MSWSEPALPRPARLGAWGLTATLAAAELAVFWLALHPTAGPGYRAYYIDGSTTCLDREVPATYTPGETVSFRSGGGAAAQALRVCGWTNPAGNGTHSVGETSRLRVRLPPVGAELRVTVELALQPSRPPQRVAFDVNGVPAHEVVVTSTEGEAVSFLVPHEALTRDAERLDIYFHFPDAVLPRPLSPNTHKRAVRLLSFRLAPVAASVSGGPPETPSAPARRG